MGKDATFLILAIGLAHKSLWRVAVVLALELAWTGEFEPGLELFGIGLLQQSPLGVARVVELGFGHCRMGSSTSAGRGARQYLRSHSFPALAPELQGRGMLSPVADNAGSPSSCRPH